MKNPVFTMPDFFENACTKSGIIEISLRQPITHFYHKLPLTFYLPAQKIAGF